MAYTFVAGAQLTAAQLNLHVNPPSFRAHKNGTNQTGVATGVYTKITWSTESWDTSSYFASDRFTPLLAGKYIATLVIGLTAAVNEKYIAPAIYKNGVLAAQNVYRASGTLDQGGLITDVFDLDGVDDYLEAFFFHDFGANATVGGTATSTYFTATRLFI